MFPSTVDKFDAVTDVKTAIAAFGAGYHRCCLRPSNTRTAEFMAHTRAHIVQNVTMSKLSSH